VKARDEMGKFMEGNIRGFLSYNATQIEENFSLNLLVLHKYLKHVRANATW